MNPLPSSCSVAALKRKTKELDQQQCTDHYLPQNTVNSRYRNFVIVNELSANNDTQLDDQAYQIVGNFMEITNFDVSKVVNGAQNRVRRVNLKIFFRP